MIIALTGYQGSGKDTLADYIGRGHKFTRLAFADQLGSLTRLKYRIHPRYFRHPAKDEYIDPKSGLTPRQAMIETAKFFRKYDEDYFIHRVEFGMQDKKRVLITDLRFPNELKFINSLRDKYKVYVVKVNRKGTKKEDSVDFIKADIEINNDGTLQDLYDEFNKHINLKEEFVKLGITPKPKEEVKKTEKKERTPIEIDYNANNVVEAYVALNLSIRSGKFKECLPLLKEYGDKLSSNALISLYLSFYTADAIPRSDKEASDILTLLYIIFKNKKIKINRQKEIDSSTCGPDIADKTLFIPWDQDKYPLTNKMMMLINDTFTA